MRHLRRRLGVDLAPGSGDAEVGVRREICGSAAEIGRERGGGGVEGGVEVEVEVEVDEGGLIC